MTTVAILVLLSVVIIGQAYPEAIAALIGLAGLGAVVAYLLMHYQIVIDVVPR